MNTAAIYHWWDYPSDALPISNLRSPIALSIATLRAVNQTIPIYVIDLNEINRWDDLPQKLNFTVVQQKPFLQNYSDKEGYRNLSRLFDINRLNIPETDLIYVDSDVFFLNDPLPLEQSPELFCFNKYNSGFFYFNKLKNKNFFDIFESYVITALNDDSFRYITKQFGECDDYFVLDETILHYMAIKMPNLFNIISTTEHFTFGTEPNNPKMIHANGVIVNNPYAKHQYELNHSRGLFCLLIKELYDNLSKLLDPKDVFSEKELKHYLINQQCFKNIVKKLNKKTDTGHILFTESLY